MVWWWPCGVCGAAATGVPNVFAHITCIADKPFNGHSGA